MAKKRKSYHVVHRKDGWAVKGEGNSRATSVHATKKDAVDSARKLARSRGTAEVVIHTKDGRIQSSDAYGTDPLPPVDPLVQRAGRFSRSSQPEQEPDRNRLAVDVWVDPGNASKQDLAEFYRALSDLQRAHGGAGIDFIEEDTEVHPWSEVLP